MALERIQPELSVKNRKNTISGCQRPSVLQGYLTLGKGHSEGQSHSLVWQHETLVALTTVDKYKRTA